MYPKQSILYSIVLLFLLNTTSTEKVFKENPKNKFTHVYVLIPSLDCIYFSMKQVCNNTEKIWKALKLQKFYSRLIFQEFLL